MGRSPKKWYGVALPNAPLRATRPSPALLPGDDGVTGKPSLKCSLSCSALANFEARPTWCAE